MRISVIGCGYLGAVHAAALASVGHEVIGVDVDADKLARLRVGDAPFHEAKLATARYHAARQLPATAMLLARIRSGGDVVMALPAEAF